MIDLILFFAIGAAFAGGWWCGKTFKSFGEAVDSATAKVRGWLA